MSCRSITLPNQANSGFSKLLVFFERSWIAFFARSWLSSYSGGRCVLTILNNILSSCTVSRFKAIPTSSMIDAECLSTSCMYPNRRAMTKFVIYAMIDCLLCTTIKLTIFHQLLLHGYPVCLSKCILFSWILGLIFFRVTHLFLLTRVYHLI